MEVLRSQSLAKGTEVLPITPFTSVVLNDALEKTKASMGSKAYFDYNAENNNCQDFISVFLRSNGMGDANDFTFVKQDTKKLFKGLSGLAKTAYTLTELGERANVLLTGAGANPSKIAEKEASKAKKTMSGKGAKSSKIAIAPSTAVEEVQPVIGESRIGSTEPSRLPRAVAVAPAPMAQSYPVEEERIRQRLISINRSIQETERSIRNIQMRTTRDLYIFGGADSRARANDIQMIENLMDELNYLYRIEDEFLSRITPTEATIEGEGMKKRKN
jgi:hypothetical protein